MLLKMSHLHPATRLALLFDDAITFSLTLVAVRSSEALLTLAAEMATGEATALTMRTANIGGDVTHIAWGAV